MFNMRNALMSGVPLLVINGQQDSRFLIHNPVLGAPNTRLAETATKYAYEVTQTDDLAVALQRCYLHARLQPRGPDLSVNSHELHAGASRQHDIQEDTHHR